MLSDLLVLKHLVFRNICLICWTTFTFTVPQIIADKIIIACKNQQDQYFSRYSERFEVIEFSYNNLFKRYITQSILFQKIPLSKDDIICI